MQELCQRLQHFFSNAEGGQPDGSVHEEPFAITFKVSLSSDYNTSGPGTYRQGEALICKRLQALGCCRYKSPLLAMLHNVKLTLGGLCRSTVTDWYWVIHVLTKHHSAHMCMQTDKRVREHWQQKLRLWCKLATTFGAASF